METGFGTDLSSVRVHTDAGADRLNSELQARAFTTGSDIFFGAGQYQPTSSSGQQLLAHELAHTLQQGASAHRQHDSTVIRRAFDVNDTNWSEANSVSASGGTSVNGVFFVKDKAGKMLVVKAAVGAAKNNLAAEMMEMSGAQGAGQRTILLDSPEGKQLVKTLGKLASKFRKANKTAKGANPIKLKVEDQLKGTKYDSVTIMEAVEQENLQDLSGKDNFGEVLERMLRNGFFNGLGRIHAADMLMGNEDRLDRQQLKNVFVNTWSGQAIGLDLDLNATSFEQTTGDLTGGSERLSELGSMAPSLEGRKFKDFVAFSIDGTDATKGVMVPETDKAKLAVDKNAKKEVQKGFKDRDSQSGMATSNFTNGADPAKLAQKFDDIVALWKQDASYPEVPPGTLAALNLVDFAKQKVMFLEGFHQGMRALIGKMGAIQQRSSELQAQTGADAFVDPRVFKVRAMYYELRQHGYRDGPVREALEMYAEHLVNGGTDDDYRTWAHALFQAQVKRLGPAPKAPTTPKAPLRRPMLKARPRPLKLVGQ